MRCVGEWKERRRGKRIVLFLRIDLGDRSNCDARVCVAGKYVCVNMCFGSRHFCGSFSV